MQLLSLSHCWIHIVIAEGHNNKAAWIKWNNPEQVIKSRAAFLDSFIWRLKAQKENVRLTYVASIKQLAVNLCIHQAEIDRVVIFKDFNRSQWDLLSATHTVKNPFTFEGCCWSPYLSAPPVGLIRTIRNGDKKVTRNWKFWFVVVFFHQQSLHLFDDSVTPKFWSATFACALWISRVHFSRSDLCTLWGLFVPLLFLGMKKPLEPFVHRWYHLFEDHFRSHSHHCHLITDFFFYMDT